MLLSMAFVSVGDWLGGVDSVGGCVGDTEGDRLEAPLGISDEAEDGFKVETTDGCPLGISDEADDGFKLEATDGCPLGISDGAEDGFKLEATDGCDWEVVSKEKKCKF